MSATSVKSNLVLLKLLLNVIARPGVLAYRSIYNHNFTLPKIQTSTLIDVLRQIAIDVNGLSVAES